MEVLEDEDGISHIPVSSGSGTRLRRYMFDSSLKERSKEHSGQIQKLEWVGVGVGRRKAFNLSSQFSFRK